MSFLRSQLWVTPVYPNHDFSGQTIIVTGSNTGLGLEAARHFARLNCAKLVLAVRSKANGDAARRSILASTQREESVVEVWDLDLASTASVKAFAEKAQRLERIDVLLENAGMQPASFRLADDGFENSLQVNVISTFLLALMLLPKLRETAEKFHTTPSLVVVTSMMHAQAEFKERDESDIYAALNKKESFATEVFGPGERYKITKLFEVLFVRELTTYHLSSSSPPPTITLVDPGLCQSSLARENGRVSTMILAVLMALLGRTTEVGSRMLVSGALAPKDLHGAYLSDGEKAAVASWIETLEGAVTQRKVYEQTMAVLERILPGIGENL